MSDRTFLDTNVLVYAVDDADPVKQKTARDLMVSLDDPVISAQVLNEFYVTVTRKLKPPVSAATATAMVEKLAELPCVPVDADLVGRALRAGQRWQLSHWDSLVIEAARQARCSRVLTEDLTAGAKYDELLIENPFR